MNRTLPLALSLIAATACGESDYTLYLIDTCVEACELGAAATRTHDETGSRASHSVDIVRTGDEDVFAAWGAPDASHATSGWLSRPGSGKVRVDTLSESTGVFTGSSTTFHASGTHDFGWAVKGVNLKRSIVYAPRGKTATAESSEELLVGAPGNRWGFNSTTGGIVTWWGRDSGGSWTQGGSITSPSSAAGDRFGEALGVPARLDRYADDIPGWIAVGAPGQDRVYLYDVTPNWSGGVTFTHTQTLSGSSGSRFGEAIVIADLDGDGRQDLAVGGPDDAHGGHLHVYRGISGSNPVSSAHRIYYGTSRASWIDGFGASLAAGFVYDNTEEALVVGAPDSDHGSLNAAGGVCLLTFNGSGSYLYLDDQDCDRGWDTQSGKQFGASVAVGDFVADYAGSNSCDEALEDVAIGAPGHTSGGRSDRGIVYVMSQWRGSPRFELSPDTTLLGSSTGGEHGFALAADYVQDTEHEDLLIGAPGISSDRGRVTVTKATSPGDDSVSGVWLAQDADGDDFSIEVVESGSQLIVTMQSGAALRLEHADGSICSAFGSPLDFFGEFTFDPATWDGTTAELEADIDTGSISGTVEATGTYNDGAGTFSLAIDESAGLMGLATFGANSDCSIVPNPIVFTRVGGLCE